MSGTVSISHEKLAQTTQALMSYNERLKSILQSLQTLSAESATLLETQAFVNKALQPLSMATLASSANWKGSSG